MRLLLASFILLGMAITAGNAQQGCQYSHFEGKQGAGYAWVASYNIAAKSFELNDTAGGHGHKIGTLETECNGNTIYLREHGSSDGNDRICVMNVRSEGFADGTCGGDVSMRGQFFP